MDTAQWPQENIGLIVKPMEELVSNMNACSSNNNNNNLDQRKAAAIRPPKEQALNCPRCNSTNTKFCYYNNYSLTQPRYFCKTCRRYWTEGGSLRNVPVGGGSRKNRRSSSSSSTSISTSSSSKISSSSHQNPKIHASQDLNLAFQTTTENYHHSTMSEFVDQLPNIGHDNQMSNNKNNFSTTTTTTTNTTNPSSTSLSEMLRNGISNSRGMSLMMNGSSNFMPADNSTTVNYSSGFALHDFKPASTLNFGIDGLGVGGGHVYGSLQSGVHHHHHQENSNGMRPLFPFEDLRQVSNTTTTTNIDQNEDQFHEQNRTGQGDSNGYWSGMLGTGGSWSELSGFIRRRSHQ